MFRRSKEPATTLDDVVELLTGIGLIAMGISARLDQVFDILGGEDDEQDDT